jgi:signal transduction histidine kinase/CheY-like chemotaxis protein/HPt (histidine-containing phosphotransfer) domain-containing protein
MTDRSPTDSLSASMQKFTRVFNDIADGTRVAQWEQILQEAQATGYPEIVAMVHASRRLEERFQRSNQHAKSYFQYALNGIIETDQQGLICHANAAAASIMNVPMRSLLEHRFITLFANQTANDRSQAHRHFDLLREQGISNSSLRLKSKDDSAPSRIVELSSIDIGGDSILHVFDDVTARQTLVEETERARVAAVQANQEKSRFLSNMSHEIRTPLNAIIGMIELLHVGELNPAQKNYVEHLLASSHGLLELMNDLLDFSKIESGHIDLEMQAFRVDQLVQDLSDMFSPTAEKKALLFSTELPANLPQTMIGDVFKIKQILRNLLSNAIKFTEHGQVSLAIAVERDDTLRSEDRQPDTYHLCFQVSDTGIGMSETDTLRLFSPFSQADTSITRRFGGTGLGLAISKRLALLMGGDIEVTSQPGHGSQFSLRITLKSAQNADTDDARSQHHQFTLTPNQFAGAKVIIAEDNITNQLVIGELLRYAGVHVHIVDDGQALLDHLSQFDAEDTSLPSLILLDVQMPRLDGLTASEIIRQRGLKLPVIGLTAGVSQYEIQQCLNAGMDEVLAKPIQMNALLSCLHRWLPSTPQENLSVPNDHPAEVARMDLPGIDLNDALPRFLGRCDLLIKARDGFLQQHKDTRLSLSACLAAQSWQEMRRLAHSIKGASANLSAQAVNKAASHLEHALDPSNYPLDTVTIAQMTDTLWHAIDTMKTEDIP